MTLLTTNLIDLMWFLAVQTKTKIEWDVQRKSSGAHSAWDTDVAHVCGWRTRAIRQCQDVRVTITLMCLGHSDELCQTIFTERAAMTYVFPTAVCHPFFPAWLRLCAIYMCICAKHFLVVKVKAVLTGWFALSRNTALCVYSIKCSACAIWTNTHKGRIFLPSDLKWPSLFAAVKQE